MKNATDALNAELVELKEIMGKMDYELASRTANLFMRTAYALDDQKGVFVGETLNTICGHLDYVLRTYRISRDEWIDTHGEAMDAMAKLVDAYVGQGADLYTHMQQLRYHVTSLVINAERRFPTRDPPAEQGRS